MDSDGMEWYRLKRSIENDQVSYTLVSMPSPKYDEDQRDNSDDSSDRGVAISYVWGAPQAYDKEGKPIYNHIVILIDEEGDEDTTSSKKVSDESRTRSLKLGVYWEDGQSFLKLLWNATEGRTFWLDQLSLPQDKKVALKLFSAIPKIYRGCTVKVLINGNRCETFSKVPLKWNAESFRGFYYYFIVHVTECTNCAKLLPWFQRLWTFEEATFARELQLIFLDSDNILEPEVRDEPISSQYRHSAETSYKLVMGLDSKASSLYLNGLAAYRNLTTLSQMRANPFPAESDGEESDIPEQVNSDALGFVDSYREAMIASYQGKFMFQCLGGSAMVLPDKEINNPPIIIIHRCSGVASREATDAKDLIIIPFLGIPGYQPPQNARDIDLTALFSDAQEQFEALTGFHFPSSYRRGFDGRMPSWQPETLDIPKDAHHLGLVYGQCLGYSDFDRKEDIYNVDMSCNGRVLRLGEGGIEFVSMEKFVQSYPTAELIRQAWRTRGPEIMAAEGARVEQRTLAWLAWSSLPSEPEFEKILDAVPGAFYLYSEDPTSDTPDIIRSELFIEKLKAFCMFALDLPLNHFQSLKDKICMVKVRGFSPGKPKVESWHPAIIDNIISRTQQISQLAIMLIDGRAYIVEPYSKSSSTKSSRCLNPRLLTFPKLAWLKKKLGMRQSSWRVVGSLDTESGVQLDCFMQTRELSDFEAYCFDAKCY